MRVVVGTFLSLDGVMQGPGGPEEDRSGGFDQGGWIVPFFSDNEEMRALVTEWTQAADGLLLGRKTYEIFAAHWPHIGPEDPIARKFNPMPKYVASRSLKKATWQNTTLLRGDAAAEVERLRREPGDELQVTGSGDLIQTLLAHDLVDEYRIWIFPLVLGRGKRLFGKGTMPGTLQLQDTRRFENGVMVHRYRPVGKPTHGSFQIEPPSREEVERRKTVDA